MEEAAGAGAGELPDGKSYMTRSQVGNNKCDGVRHYVCSCDLCAEAWSLRHRHPHGDALFPDNYE